MTRFNVLVGFVLVAVLVVGCNKAQPTAPPSNSSKETSTTVSTEVTEAVPVPDPDASVQAADEAKTKLAAVLAAIKDGKLDQAETDLKALEAMKDLPADMQAQIKQARVALDAAKALQKPDIPKLPV